MYKNNNVKLRNVFYITNIYLHLERETHTVGQGESEIVNRLYIKYSVTHNTQTILLQFYAADKNSFNTFFFGLTIKFSFANNK